MSISQSNKKADPNCEICNGTGLLVEDDTEWQGEPRKKRWDCSCVEITPQPPTWAELAELSRQVLAESEKTLAALQEATRMLGVRS